MTDEVPRRLPVDFIWSSTGQQHVEYAIGQTFEGRIGEYLGRDELGHGGQASVSVVYVKGQAVARKRMHLEGVDEEARREARMLESIIHRHVRLYLTWTVLVRL
jgi:hypothetical protein